MWKALKSKWVISTGVILAAALATFAILESTVKQQLTITFTGYTNMGAGLLNASFLVRNAGEEVLFITENGFVQIKERGEWTEPASTKSRVIGLQAHESIVLSIPKPSHGRTWRIAVFSGRPRTPFMRRLGHLYERQPFHFDALTYLFLAPVLRQTPTYSKELQE